jgi:hypothetical protein
MDKKKLNRIIFIVVIQLVVIILLVLFFPKSEESCESIKDEIHDLYVQANYCTEDLDCVEVYFPCPAGCGALVNKDANLFRAKMLKNRYSRHCKCDSHCDPSFSESKSVVKCENSKCVRKYVDENGNYLN